MADRIEMHWHTDSATSAIPEPQRYSVGVTTNDKSFSSPPPQDAMTDSLSEELLIVGYDSECNNRSMLTNS